MKPIPLAYFSNNPSDQELITGVAIDSRKVQPGDLFFALTGKKVEGADFLEMAKSQGAIAACVPKEYTGSSFGLKLMRVDSVLIFLQECAQKALKERKSQVVAITGSIGKTSTKGFVKRFLQNKYKVFATPENYNTESTIPLSILMAEGDEDFLILEMGMTKGGDIAELVRIAPPDIALITSVAIQHAEDFQDGLLDIAKEKSALFSHPKTRLGIYHEDILHKEILQKTGVCPKKTFSETSRAADYFIEFVSENMMRITTQKDSILLPFPIPVKAHAINVLGAFTIGDALGVPWEEMAHEALFLTLPSQRFERIEKGGIIFINDAYNANVESMQAALRSLPKHLGKKIAVLSEMNALGNYSEKGHEEVAKTSLLHTDVLFCIGKRAEIMHKIWRKNQREAYYFETKEELISQLKTFAKKGDLVLLKGARAWALEDVLLGF